MAGGVTANVRAGDDQNGRTISLQAGQTLLVTLSSTYWSFQGSSNPQVLAPVGTATASPVPKSTCPGPGSVCGTVAQVFHALAPGTAQVTATRVSCGEALRCTGDSGLYQLTVQVRAAPQ
jgi:hypothetical protein